MFYYTSSEASVLNIRNKEGTPKTKKNEGKNTRLLIIII